MSYDNTNSGAIFINDKQGNEKRPDYTGKLNVEGKQFYISAWVKDSNQGNKFLSISIKPSEFKTAKHNNSGVVYLGKVEENTPEYQESKDGQSNTGLPF